MVLLTRNALSTYWNASSSFNPHAVDLKNSLKNRSKQAKFDSNNISANSPLKGSDKPIDVGKKKLAKTESVVLNFKSSAHQLTRYKCVLENSSLYEILPRQCMITHIIYILF